MPVRLKIDIQLNGHFESVFEQDIVEADFYGLKEAAGGTSYRGEVLLDNVDGLYSYSNVGPGTKVRVSFSLGDGLPYFQRFIFYIDDKGIQDIRGPGRKRSVRLGLQDFSAVLRKTDESRDWSSPAVLTYSVICDKSQPEKSLVHGIAQRAGLGVADIDCSTIAVTLPYVRLKKSVWDELSSLATAYRCHLECAPEKPLVFAHSPYQAEALNDDEYSYTFTGEDIFYLRKTERADLYRNTIRLKINLPVVLEKQEIWCYDDPPILYDDALLPRYPFRATISRNIEQEGYEALYRIHNHGKEQSVIYADMIDSKDEAENRLEYDGGPFHYACYDVSSHHDRAIISLRKEADGDLYCASIQGRPIVLDLNRSCFLKDNEAVQQKGTRALNVTGTYFSEDEIDGKPQYEDWVMRELAERIQNKREYSVKTHQGLFHARVGAKVKIQTSQEILSGTINALAFRYRKNGAFVSEFQIR
jgi:hypothetical protein